MTKLLTFLAWLAVLIMWGCAATVYVSAATYGKYIAVVGLGFPFCVAAVLAVGMVCLLLKPRQGLWQACRVESRHCAC